MLLRHAKSDWPDGVDDHARPLAKRGRQASPVMGGYMAAQGLVPDLAVISTARRTQETWELVRPAFARPVAQRDEPRIYEAAAGTILEIIRETESGIHALLLVGHNPGLQDLALKLIGQASGPDMARLREKYPTAGLAVIDFPAGTWREVTAAGRLERFETPRSVINRDEA
jgi:phosphohistidine phosphatase